MKRIVLALLSALSSTAWAQADDALLREKLAYPSIAFNQWTLPFPYLPSAIALFWPLSLMPQPVAFAVWMLLQAVSLVVILRAALRMCGADASGREQARTRRRRPGRRVMAFVQQDQLATAMEDGAGWHALDLERDAGRLIVVGIAHHHQAVGLAKAELGPGRQGGVGSVKDEGGIHLASREPVGLAALRFRSQHLHLIADAAQRRRQQHREAGRRNIGPGWEQGEGTRLAPPLGRSHGVAQRNVAHQGRQNLRVVSGE